MKKLALILTFLATSMANAGDEVGGGGGSRMIVKTVNHPFMNSGDVGGGGGPKITLKHQRDGFENLFGPVTGDGVGARQLNEEVQSSDLIGGGGGGHAELPRIAKISVEKIEGIINYHNDFIDRKQLSQGDINLSLDGAQIDESWLYVNPKLVKEVLIDGRYYSAKELVEEY